MADLVRLEDAVLDLEAVEVQGQQERRNQRKVALRGLAHQSRAQVVTPATDDAA